MKDNNCAYCMRGELLDKFGIDPKRAVFIDDNPENIAAAGKCGIGGILHESYEKTVARLTEIGVRVQTERGAT